MMKLGALARVLGVRGARDARLGVLGEVVHTPVRDAQASES